MGLLIVKERSSLQMPFEYLKRATDRHCVCDVVERLSFQKYSQTWRFNKNISRTISRSVYGLEQIEARLFSCVLAQYSNGQTNAYP